MSGPVGEFGALVVETDVDVAVVTTLRRWLPMYLAEAERERGLSNRTLARPRPESYANTLEDDEFLDHVLPAVIVTTAQTRESDTGAEDRYWAAWRVIVSCVVRGRTPAESRAVAALFSGCVRRILVQQQDLGGFAAGVRWVNGNVAAVADTTDKGRYLTAGINEMTVYVDEVLQGGVGPIVPDPYYPDADPEGAPDAPLDPLAAVSAVTVSITSKES